MTHYRVRVIPMLPTNSDIACGRHGYPSESGPHASLDAATDRAIEESNNNLVADVLLQEDYRTIRRYRHGREATS